MQSQAAIEKSQFAALSHKLSTGRYGAYEALFIVDMQKDRIPVAMATKGSGKGRARRSDQGPARVKGGLLFLQGYSTEAHNSFHERHLECVCPTIRTSIGEIPAARACPEPPTSCREKIRTFVEDANLRQICVDGRSASTERTEISPSQLLLKQQ